MFRIVRPTNSRRTQGGASLCPGLSHYAPLGLDRWPITVTCKRVADPFAGRRASGSKLTGEKEPASKLRRKEGLGIVAKAGLEPATHGL